jgi:hypothetical protein
MLASKNVPGFTAEDSLYKTMGHYAMASVHNGVAAQVVPQFPRTLPICGWRKVVCGSALPGYPVPMCWEYYCYFPGSSRNIESTFG